MSRVVVVALVGLTAAACFGGTHEGAPATTTVTSAVFPRSDGGSIGDRIARAVCAHEVECGRVRDPGMCIDASRMRVARELGSWTCDAESARIGAEECLSALRGAGCAVNLSTKGDVCSRNGGCATVEGDRPAASR